LTEKANSKKILRYLQKNLPYSYNVKTLFRAFKGEISENAIKQVLHRLGKKNKIQRETRGFYRAKVDANTIHFLETPPTLLHGIMLSCETKQKLQKSIHGIPSQSYNDEALRWFDAMGFLPTTNFRYYKDEWFDGRKVTITFHLKGRIDLYIGCSKNPLSYPDFCKLLDTLNGYLTLWIPVDKKKVRLLEVGISRDYQTLRLDGVSEITLHKFTNAWSRVYYKEDIGATRFEHHVKVDLDIDSALLSFRLLDNNFVSNGNGFSRPDERRDVA